MNDPHDKLTLRSGTDLILISIKLNQNIPSFVNGIDPVQVASE